MAVVVGYVRSAEGRAALRAAVEEVRRRNARLVVVHSSKGGARESTDEVLAYRDDLEHLEKRLAARGLPVEVHERVLGNTPAVDLVDVTHEVDADLIVIGLRPRSPVGKLVLGSNAQEILLTADCPVLAVKATDADRRADSEPLASEV